MLRYAAVQPPLSPTPSYLMYANIPFEDMQAGIVSPSYAYSTCPETLRASFPVCEQRRFCFLRLLQGPGPATPVRFAGSCHETPHPHRRLSVAAAPYPPRAPRRSLSRRRRARPDATRGPTRGHSPARCVQSAIPGCRRRGDLYCPPPLRPSKCSARMGRSSRRSRRGGKSIRNTFRR